MNEDWLAGTVYRGFDSGYRVALMSGGSRRLWNQLLRGTPSSVLYLFRSALAGGFGLPSAPAFISPSLSRSFFLALVRLRDVRAGGKIYSV